MFCNGWHFVLQQVSFVCNGYHFFAHQCNKVLKINIKLFILLNNEQIPSLVNSLVAQTNNTIIRPISLALSPTARSATLCLLRGSLGNQNWISHSSKLFDNALMIKLSFSSVWEFTNQDARFYALWVFEGLQ